MKAEDRIGAFLQHSALASSIAPRIAARNWGRAPAPLNNGESTAIGRDQSGQTVGIIPAAAPRARGSPGRGIRSGLRNRGAPPKLAWSALRDSVFCHPLPSWGLATTPSIPMSTGAHFLAFDLGAESGRAMLGRLHGGVLDVSEIHRFQRAGSPERLAALGHPPSLARDAAAAGAGRPAADRQHRRRHLGLRLRARRRAGRPARRTRITIATRAPTASWKPSSSGCRPTRSTRITGIQFLPFNTLYQLYAACRATPRLIDAATASVTIPDLLNYWLTGS